MNVFELFGKLSLDTSEYDSKLNDEEKKTEKSSGKLSSGLGKTAKVVGAAALTALTTASVAIVGITSKAVAAYADYEQLSDGVKKLFGDDSYTTVLANAENAYETAGMSMNDYLDTVTSFSASLIASLEGDTVKAANYADMAIQDMADNANTYGTDIASIQNAYQGFAKQNYTMLDNLKLGYGGTKEEMERLLEDAMEIKEANGEMADYSIDSFADIVEAIHTIQEATNITGTTQKESAKTITGSLNSIKAAWNNLLVEVAKDNGDIEGSIEKLSNKVLQFARNVVPVVGRVLDGVSEALKVGLPLIAEQLPALIGDFLPTLIGAVLSLTQSLIQALPEILQIVLDQIPVLITGILDVLVSTIPMLVQSLTEMTFKLIDSVIELIPDIINAVVQITLAIIEFTTQPENVIKIVNIVFEIIAAVIGAIIEAIPDIVEVLPEIIINIHIALIELIPTILAGLLNVIIQICSSLVTMGSKFIDVLIGWWNSADSWIKGKASSIKNWGKDLIDNFIGGIKEKWQKLKDTVSNVGQSIKDFLGFSEPKKGPLSNFHTYAPDMMKLFAQGIKENEGLVTGQIEKSFNFSNKIKAYDTADVRGVGETYSDTPINITVQSVLDGKVIGQTSTKYSRKIARAVGGS